MANPKIYELAYSGKEVDEAIYKIQNLDLSKLSSITVLDCSEATPYNLNFLRVPGLYSAGYVLAASAPSGVAGIHPVYIYVSTYSEGDKSFLVQSLVAGDSSYSRSSDDLGLNWTNWVTKGGITEAEEISAEEVEGIWDSVFGSDSQLSHEAAISLLNAAQAATHKLGTSSDAQTTSTPTRRTVAS